MPVLFRFKPDQFIAYAVISVLAASMFPAATIAGAQAPITVALVPSAIYGSVLTDPDGWTLYTWDGDAEGVSNCYDACAAAWLPYPGGTTLQAPADLLGALGWIDRGDGTWQVTLDNWPLYYYSGDVQPGDTN